MPVDLFAQAQKQRVKKAPIDLFKKYNIGAPEPELAPYGKNAVGQIGAAAANVGRGFYNSAFANPATFVNQKIINPTLGRALNFKLRDIPELPIENENQFVPQVGNFLGQIGGMGLTSEMLGGAVPAALKSRSLIGPLTRYGAAAASAGLGSPEGNRLDSALLTAMLGPVGDVVMGGLTHSPSLLKKWVGGQGKSGPITAAEFKENMAAQPKGIDLPLSDVAQSPSLQRLQTKAAITPLSGVMRSYDKLNEHVRKLLDKLHTGATPDIDDINQHVYNAYDSSYQNAKTKTQDAYDALGNAADNARVKFNPDEYYKAIQKQLDYADENMKSNPEEYGLARNMVLGIRDIPFDKIKKDYILARDATNSAFNVLSDKAHAADIKFKSDPYDQAVDQVLGDIHGNMAFNSSRYANLKNIVDRFKNKSLSTITGNEPSLIKNFKDAGTVLGRLNKLESDYANNSRAKSYFNKIKNGLYDSIYDSTPSIEGISKYREAAGKARSAQTKYEKLENGKVSPFFSLYENPGEKAINTGAHKDILNNFSDANHLVRRLNRMWRANYRDPIKLNFIKRLSAGLDRSIHQSAIGEPILTKTLADAKNARKYQGQYERLTADKETPFYAVAGNPLNNETGNFLSSYLKPSSGLNENFNLTNSLFSKLSDPIKKDIVHHLLRNQTLPQQIRILSKFSPRQREVIFGKNKPITDELIKVLKLFPEAKTPGFMPKTGYAGSGSIMSTLGKAGSVGALAGAAGGRPEAAANVAKTLVGTLVGNRLLQNVLRSPALKNMYLKSLERSERPQRLPGPYNAFRKTLPFAASATNNQDRGS